MLVYPGLGDGKFGPAVNGGQGFFTGTNPVGITVADLGNGRPDLVIADRGSNDVSILLNQRRPAAASRSCPAPGSGPATARWRRPSGTSTACPNILVSNSLSNNVRSSGRRRRVLQRPEPDHLPRRHQPGADLRRQLRRVAGLRDRQRRVERRHRRLRLPDRAPATAPSAPAASGPEAAFMVPSAQRVRRPGRRQQRRRRLLAPGRGRLGLELASTFIDVGPAEPDVAGLLDPHRRPGRVLRVDGRGRGRVAAGLLALGRHPATSPASVPLRDSSLALVATLLTVTLEPQRA